MQESTAVGATVHMVPNRRFFLSLPHRKGAAIPTLIESIKFPLSPTLGRSQLIERERQLAIIISAQWLQGVAEGSRRPIYLDKALLLPGTIQCKKAGHLGWDA